MAKSDKKWAADTTAGAAKLALAVLEPFIDNSAFRDYMEEDEWTPGQYDDMLLSLQQVAAGDQREAEFTLRDSVTGKTLKVGAVVAGNFLNLRPAGYDNPVSLDFYDGRLRVLVNADAEEEEPQIIDLEGARQ